MAKPDLEKYYDVFVDAAVQHGEARNAKVANKNAAKLHRIFLFFQNHTNLAPEFYAKLYDHEDPSVKTWACGHSLGLNINVVIAEMILEGLSKDKSLGILSLNARYTLENWKKRGYLIQ
jgi:hypothetical protein